MTDKEKAWLRRELQANSISQFMHGEQGALIATAKIVATVPDMNAKFYAATQVMDEARHVEAYKRLLHEKFGVAYPINKALQTLLEQTLTDRRWDMTYLGMQVLIEGLALAAFQSIRDKAGNTLAAAVNAYVMQDEARHVSFGRLALRDYYPQLSEAERDEREEFAVEALHFMRDRFNQSEVWERLGLPAADARRHPLQFQADELLPRPAVQPRRADGQGHRPVGPAGAEGVRRDGRDGLRQDRRRRAARQRRPGRRGVRREDVRREVDRRRIGRRRITANRFDSIASRRLAIRLRPMPLPARGLVTSTLSLLPLPATTSGLWVVGCRDAVSISTLAAPNAPPMPTAIQVSIHIR